MKGLLYIRPANTWLAVQACAASCIRPSICGWRAPRRATQSLVFIVDGLDPALIERSYRQWCWLSPIQPFVRWAEIENARLVPESTAMALAMNEGVAT